ncbi:plastid lipid-associated fibrillin [Chloropicon primus]|uniref:Plastid lipid-associated fibrillin n=1 Tax=Chloropicon primus TaxID=1764295 RepID=A0A5B8MHL9_9CHLO|nr:plastid lipid-associated fibrillin [Chloropicon primus]UPQ98982.1 plastid lipid-associated fibrillin [Chloropicon primus]|eukprot:QDZ19771.1 plastid lipid-associated fibrillin [Chloropicon primus]
MRTRALEPAASTSGKPVAEKRLREALFEGSTRRDDSIGPELKRVIDECVAKLEEEGGVRDPTASDLINGRWKLLFTTRPGTSSPIQRAFTGIETFSIYQDIDLEGLQPKVDNVVVFGDSVGVLKVEAEAVTDKRPRAGFVPRRGQGLPFLGKSDSTPPSGPNKRIDFQFSKAAFDLKALPFNIPYPVPFKLLQDESKGWLDTTYLSNDLRLSRGNKGTLFILEREGQGGQGDQDPEQETNVMSLIDRGAEADKVQAAIDAFLSESDGQDSLELLEGQWKLAWTSQGATASGIQKLATSFDNFQVIGKGQGSDTLNELENVALFSREPEVVLRAKASCSKDSVDARKVNVTISGADLNLLGLHIPLGFINGDGWLEVLYVDESIRISKGSKGSLFVHKRSNQAL